MANKINSNYGESNMKKFIKYSISFSLVFFLFQMSVSAHGPGEKVSVPCSAHIKVEKRSSGWSGTMFTNVALTDSLLKSHNAINQTDGQYPIPMEVEITTKDGEKIPMIVGYNYEVEGGNMLSSFQTYNDLHVFFNRLKEESGKDETMERFGEFLNITCSFNSHSVEYHSVTEE